MPLRFRRLPWDERRVFVSSLAGDWLMMERQAFERFVRHELPASDAVLADLEARDSAHRSRPRISASEPDSIPLVISRPEPSGPSRRLGLERMLRPFSTWSTKPLRPRYA